MDKSISHILQRSYELGPRITFQRVRARSINLLSESGQSLWWGWQARQAMSDRALLARTTGDWVSVDGLLDHLASRPAASFVLPHDSGPATAQVLRVHYPEHLAALVATADAACQNEFTLLGQVFRFPQGIDWHQDPVTGWHWPLFHRSRLAKWLGAERPVDLIRFWELNRHQHFITLGIAYWLTGQSCYRDAFDSQITSWIASNPLQHGVNWYYPLEIAIRLIAWTTAFQFFRHAPDFGKKIGEIFLKSLWQQADFLASHLQTRRSAVPNNHLLAELTGLIIVGTAFPEFRAAAAWRETGLALLEKQAVAQTHPDGVNREQASGYHRFIAELLLLIVARSRQGAIPASPILENTLARMLDYILYSQTPCGTMPTWGDSDYGRALGLGQNKDFYDFRPLLSTGAALFNRPDWKQGAGYFDEESFWLLGNSGRAAWERIEARPPAETSCAFSDAGLYIIRDTWQANTDVAFFRTGPFGLGGEGHCAHAHCDLLSLILWMNGKPVLVDSGTYLYHGALRDAFRLGTAHNTVLIDGREQATPLANFNWENILTAQCEQWTGNRVTGKIVFPGPLNFFRELDHPQSGVWNLTDKLSGQNEHTLEWFFHFAPEWDLKLDSEKKRVSVFESDHLFAQITLPELCVQAELRDSFYSYTYGAKQANRKLVACWRGDLSQGVTFLWRFQLIGE